MDKPTPAEALSSQLIRWHDNLRGGRPLRELIDTHDFKNSRRLWVTPTRTRVPLGAANRRAHFAGAARAGREREKLDRLFEFNDDKSESTMIITTPGCFPSATRGTWDSRSMQIPIRLELECHGEDATHTIRGLLHRVQLQVRVQNASSSNVATGGQASVHQRVQFLSDVQQNQRPSPDTRVQLEVRMVSCFSVSDNEWLSVILPGRGLAWVRRQDVIASSVMDTLSPIPGFPRIIIKSISDDSMDNIASPLKLAGHDTTELRVGGHNWPHRNRRLVSPSAHCVPQAGDAVCERRVF